jgi:hypothetical protein
MSVFTGKVTLQVEGFKVESYFLPCRGFVELSTIG